MIMSYLRYRGLERKIEGNSLILSHFYIFKAQKIPGEPFENYFRTIYNAYNEESSTKGTLMFGREFRVRMVKSKKDENETTPTHDFENLAHIASDALDNMAKKAVLATVAFVALDTVRQIVVAKATK